MQVPWIPEVPRKTENVTSGFTTTRPRSGTSCSASLWYSNMSGKQRGNQALVGAIPFCGEYPGPRFEDKFQSANQMDGISKAGGDKTAAS